MYNKKKTEILLLLIKLTAEALKLHRVPHRMATGDWTDQSETSFDNSIKMKWEREQKKKKKKKKEASEENCQWKTHQVRRWRAAIDDDERVCPGCRKETPQAASLQDRASSTASGKRPRNQGSNPNTAIQREKSFEDSFRTLFFFLVATFLVFISRFITIPPPRIVGFFSQNGTTFLGHQRPIENTSGRGEGGTRTRRLWTILLRRSSTHFSAIFLDSFSRNLHDRVNPPKTNKTPEGRTRRFSGAVMKLD